ncbi:MAG: hypothetical protein ACREBC_37755, partial [Pyrinomonadaceae bacterium]
MEINWVTVVLLLPAVVLIAAGVAILLLFFFGNLTQVDVRFESSDGTWADIERTFKGLRFDTLARCFDEYKRAVGNESISLLRTTPMEWHKVNLWPTYLLNPKWRVPYAHRRIPTEQLIPPISRSNEPLMPAWASDAWLLLSIIYAGAPADSADRARIIEVGDSINHAIFTDEELEGGLSRLLSGGLIREGNGHFSP